MLLIILQKVILICYRYIISRRPKYGITLADDLISYLDYVDISKITSMYPWVTFVDLFYDIAWLIQNLKNASVFFQES